MKIVVIQSGPDYEVLLLTSILIGLHKKYPGSEIYWVGEPQYFDLLKFNRRIKECLGIDRDITFSTLSQLCNLDLGINPCLNRRARQFASCLPAKQWLGFTKSGPVNRQAEFTQKILAGELSTHKNVLDIYYHLAGLQWAGEGYGLSYYPKHKQDQERGIFITGRANAPEGTRFGLPTNLLERFDVINQFHEIHTDSLFVLHSALALRKQTYFYEQKPLNYGIEFFRHGSVVPIESQTSTEGLQTIPVQ